LLVLELNVTLHQAWSSTLILCKNCRMSIGINSKTLQQSFIDELYSVQLVSNAHYVVMIQIDTSQRLFSLTYQWLDTESFVS
jgi:hypothetical protein